MPALCKGTPVVYSLNGIFEYEVGCRQTRGRILSIVLSDELEKTDRIDHMNARHHVVSCHRVGLLASFLGKCSMPEGRWRNEVEMAQDGTGEARGLWADVLSTQSTREPDVVKGIKESMTVESRERAVTRDGR